MIGSVLGAGITSLVMKDQPLLAVAAAMVWGAMFLFASTWTTSTGDLVRCGAHRMAAYVLRLSAIGHELCLDQKFLALIGCGG